MPFQVDKLPTENFQPLISKQFNSHVSSESPRNAMNEREKKSSFLLSLIIIYSYFTFVLEILKIIVSLNGTVNCESFFSFFWFLFCLLVASVLCSFFLSLWHYSSRNLLLLQPSIKVNVCLVMSSVFFQKFVLLFFLLLDSPLKWFVQFSDKTIFFYVNIFWSCIKWWYTLLLLRSAAHSVLVFMEMT